MSLGLIRTDRTQLPYEAVEQRGEISFVFDLVEPNNRVSVGSSARLQRVSERFCQPIRIRRNRVLDLLPRLVRSAVIRSAQQLADLVFNFIQPLRFAAGDHGELKRPPLPADQACLLIRQGTKRKCPAINDRMKITRIGAAHPVAFNDSQ